MRRIPRCLHRAALLVLVVAMLAGCQVKVTVDTAMNRDGSGTITVGVGLDDKALARLGDPNAQIKVDDLRAAGWSVTPATKGADGLTWIRASKAVANADELNRVMAEITGPDGMFKGYRFTRTETDADTTYRIEGTVDASKGISQFSDPDLAGKLNGDPFGGNLQAIEAEEGKPVADMVSFTVTASVAGGPPTEVHPSLKDTAAIPVDVSTVEPKPPSALASLALYAAIALGVGLVVAMLVGARRRFASRPQ